MVFLKVEQLENKNQFVIDVKDSENRRYKIFQSYESMIALYDEDKRELILFKDWDYSKTTLKHLYIFINQYAYSVVKNDIYYSICDMINNAKNKRAKIQKLIDKNIIDYLSNSTFNN